MRLLVVQESVDLGGIWCKFLRGRGFSATLATSSADALTALSAAEFDALILDPMIDGAGIPVADFATFRNPDVQILAVTRSSFFSDSAILQMITNARGVLHEPVRPEDLAAYVEHFDHRSAARGAAAAEGSLTPRRAGRGDAVPSSRRRAQRG